MSERPVDLGGYFERIGYDGAPRADLETLRALHVLHPAAIPFEALDVLAGRGVDLAPEAVDAKLIAARRGGYCFEQNNLFRRVLTALGFEVEGLIARVLWMSPPDAPLGARSHMALRVTVDGEPWLADVGVGTCTLTEPLRIVLDERQRTGHEDFRIRAIGRELQLEVDIAGAWTPVYRASPDPAEQSDYESGNWWTSTHPDSLFRNHLVVTRVAADARFTLIDGRLTIRRPGQDAEQRQLDAAGVELVLSDTFGLPFDEAWRPICRKAVEAAP
jgi:N-hydroxyarylamine O-acetyltransferase